MTPSPGEALLFSITIKMKERDSVTRVDVRYPFEKYDENAQLVETFQEPPQYDIRFLYMKTRKGSPVFKIFAQRCDLDVEQYEIEIIGQKKIKSVMK